MSEDVRRMGTYAPGRIFGIAEKPVWKRATKVIDERQGVKEFPILIVDGLARIHASRSEATGHFDVFTTTILWTG